MSTDCPDRLSCGQYLACVSLAWACCIAGGFDTSVILPVEACEAQVMQAGAICVDGDADGLEQLTQSLVLQERQSQMTISQAMLLLLLHRGIENATLVIEIIRPCR